MSFEETTIGPCRLIHADCLEVLPELEEISACVTDPPYGLEFMGKDWDHGIPGVKFWKLITNALKPGAHLLAFGGTRTHHRLMCAIEDSGFEVRDCIMWVYGSGFPKSLDVSKAIDKAAGVEREIIGSQSTQIGNYLKSKEGPGAGGNKPATKSRYTGNVLGPPTTEEAKQWSGWGTALKPSFEPIVWVNKPLTVIPPSDTIRETNSLIGTMICLLLSNVNDVNQIFKLNPKGLIQPASVLCLVGLLHGNKSGKLKEKMDTFKSPETVLTCLNIASLWSSILTDVLKQKNTSTTSMEIDPIIALKILNSLILKNIPNSIIQDSNRINEQLLNAKTVENKSIDSNQHWKHILKHIAIEVASWKASKIGTFANTAAKNLQQIIPSVYSVLQDVTTNLNAKNNITPAYEPIVLCRKSLIGTVAANVIEHGTGALNIDECRIDGIPPSVPQSKFHNHKYANSESLNKGIGFGKGRSGEMSQSDKGRYPANFIHDGSEEVLELFPDSNGQQGNTGPEFKSGKTSNTYGDYQSRNEFNARNDSGSAARFFYCAKASKSERGKGNTHPTVKPIDLLHYLVCLVAPKDSIVLDPFMGSGTTGIVCIRNNCEFIGIEMNKEYYDIAVKRIKKEWKDHNAGFMPKKYAPPNPKKKPKFSGFDI